LGYSIPTPLNYLNALNTTGFWLVAVLPAPPLIKIYTSILLNPQNALNPGWISD